MFCNSKRRHSYLDYISPNELEKDIMKSLEKIRFLLVYNWLVFRGYSNLQKGKN